MSGDARPDRSARVAGTDLPTGGDVKLVPGGPCDLINVSESGALVEGKTKLHVGAIVKLHLGGDHPRQVTGRVVRCQVSAIHRDSSMSYQVGIAFEDAAAIGDVVVERAAPAEQPAPPPLEDAVPPPLLEAAGRPLERAEPAELAELVNEW